MSLFAGIYRLRDDGPLLDPESIETIKRVISRSADLVTSFSDKRLFLAKVDVGAFPERAFIAGEKDCAATVAGLPLLNSPSNEVRSRAKDLQKICSHVNRGDRGVFRDCQGSYAICSYRVSDGLLTLATDKLGARPLYIHIGNDHIYFSTAIRVLEFLESVPKKCDIQGMAERIAIGFPLADRTPYDGIKILEGGEYLIAKHGESRRGSYFRLDEIPPTSSTVPQLLDRAYEVFLGALARRSEKQSTVAAALSGGLDSRCIVTGLHALGKRVCTLTWSARGYIDGPLAMSYAKALGVTQVLRTIPPFPDWSDYIECLRNLEWPVHDGPQHRGLIFSGDGGSVGMGYDYLTAERVGWMRSGRVDLWTDWFVATHALPRSFMSRKMYGRFQEALFYGVKTEVGRIKSHEPGRDLHLFYMMNDQRRHLHPFYEDIDICRVDYLVPFFDGDLVELLVSGPVDAFLLHTFYHQWLDRFPPIIKAVAWQTYPGHLPCPVKVDVSGRRQWNPPWRDRFAGKNYRAFTNCAQLMLQGNVSSAYMSRSHLVVAMALHALRLRCYSYAFSACVDLHHALLRCRDREVA